MTPSASLVPLEEGTVPSGRPARAQQFAISVNSNSLGLATKICVFCVVCVKLESHPGGRTGAATCKNVSKFS